MAAQMNKVSSRDQKAMAAQVNQVVDSFSAAIDSAFEAELDYIKEELRNNKPMAYTLSGLLKNKSLAALLDGTARAEADAALSQGKLASPGGQKLMKLRQSVTKWKHLAHQPEAMMKVLHAIEPTIFGAGR